MNPSTATAFEALSIDLTTHNRRLPEAPRRDYTPNEVAEPEPVPEVPPGLLQCDGVPYHKAIQPELKTIAPELGELTKLAARESRILEAANEFTTAQAKADFEAESGALRADPSAANITKLKSIGSLEDRRASYAVQYRSLRREAEKLQLEAIPMITAISERLSRRLGELSQQAASEELAVFKKWGIAGYQSRISDHFTRVRQELQINTAHFGRGHFHGTIQGWIKRFLAEA